MSKHSPIIINDPVPFIIESFKNVFPDLKTPVIQYEHMSMRIKGLYHEDSKLIAINSRIPIDRVPEILAHELVHYAKGLPNHGPKFHSYVRKIHLQAYTKYKMKFEKI